MKVKIVCYEDVDKWILGKFAKKLNETLIKLNVHSEIGKKVDPVADINHHIIYYDFNGEKSTIDTLMITHIDSNAKLELVKRQLKIAKLGICMSRDTMNKLSIMGVPRNKLCFVNPAHDFEIKPKQIVIGITSKVQESGCKRETMLLDLVQKVDPRLFEFRIMGKGWDHIVSTLKNLGFTVQYYNDFDYGEYVKLIPSLDYYLYLGEDEGSMGFIDALAAGVKTIVTPQGYHLDAQGGITYQFNNINELIQIFKSISIEKTNLIQSVSSWNWHNYTKKHLEIWKYLLEKEKEHKKSFFVSEFKDGINSLQEFDLTVVNQTNHLSRIKLKIKLMIGTIKTKYYSSEKLKSIRKIVSSVKIFLF